MVSLRPGSQIRGLRMTLLCLGSPKNVSFPRLEAAKATASPVHPLKTGITPTKDTAQAIYSPQACIFVAKQVWRRMSDHG